MKIKFVVNGEPLMEQEHPFPLTFIAGQGLVLDNEAYEVVSSIKDGDGLIVALKEPAYCDDCGMAVVLPSNRPRCLCKDEVEQT